MTSSTVLVLGASGKTGRRVTDHLRRGGHTVRAASRHGSTRFDWHDESTWGPALDGADAVYVVDSLDEHAADLAGRFARRATDAGVRRLVLLSMRVSREWHELGVPGALAVEDAVRAAAPHATIVRPTWFLQNLLEDPLFSDGIDAGELRLPTGDGEEAFIDVDDVGAVAAVALTEPGHEGRVHELSGPRAIAWRTAVTEIGRAVGRDVAYVPITIAEFADTLTRHGYPAGHVELLSLLMEHTAASRSAAVSTGVHDVLGRPPVDLAGYTARVTASVAAR